jgi:hypothetical protein
MGKHERLENRYPGFKLLQWKMAPSCGDLRYHQYKRLCRWRSKSPIFRVPLQIGNEIDYYDWPVNGSLDDIRIYRRALTPVQVTALFKMHGFTGDTTPPDTTHPDRVTGLSYSISGTAGNLSLVLSWTSVLSAFAYGVYFEEGTTVNQYSAFRVASKNSYTFTPGALTEGNQYAFAVTFTKTDGTESALSDPLMVEFKAQ